MAETTMFQQKGCEYFFLLFEEWINEMEGVKSRWRGEFFLFFVQFSLVKCQARGKLFRENGFLQAVCLKGAAAFDLLYESNVKKCSIKVFHEYQRLKVFCRKK